MISERGATLTDEERYESVNAMVRLLRRTSNAEKANHLWEVYINPETTDFIRLEIEEALDQLTEARRRADLGDEIFERLTSGAKPSLAALERNPLAGLTILKRQSVWDVLRSFLGRKVNLDHLRYFQLFKAAYPHIERSLEAIKKSVTAEDWNQKIIPAIGFRLKLSALESDVLEPEQLKKNAFESVNALIDKLQGQDNLSEYLAKNNPASIQVLWEARMKILFSSLKLAQKGVRIEWREGAMTNQELELKLNQINQVMGEMRVSARRGGSYLNFHLANHLALTEKIVNEQYKDHPEYGQKVLTDFEKYTQSPDSF